MLNFTDVEGSSSVMTEHNTLKVTGDKRLFLPKVISAEYRLSINSLKIRVEPERNI